MIVIISHLFLVCKDFFYQFPARNILQQLHVSNFDMWENNELDLKNILILNVIIN